MSHPQHPNCPDCSKALFKSPAAAKVKPSDPYAYCRNKACKQYTFRTLGADFDPKKGVKADLAAALKVGAKAKVRMLGTPLLDRQGRVVVEPGGKLAPTIVAHPETGIPVPSDTRPAETKPTSKRGRKRAAVPVSEAPKRPAEPEALAKARRRLKGLLAQIIPGGTPRESAGLVLAILSQETGNQRAAETLIDEFELDKKFGLQKFAAPNS